MTQPSPERREALLFEKQRVSYHLGQWSRVTGELSITTERIRFKPHMFMKPFELAYAEIAAVPDMGFFGLSPCFRLVLKDGREVAFSLNTPLSEETQAVIGLLRDQK